jgi:hypothetical protein
MISAVAGIGHGVPEVFQWELFTRNRSRHYNGMALTPVSHAASHGMSVLNSRSIW